MGDGVGLEYRLKTPLQEQDIRRLKVYDTIYLTGAIYNLPDQPAYARSLDLQAKGQSPIDLTNSATMHAPTCASKIGGKWVLAYAGVTTSWRLRKIIPDFIKQFKVRAIIGKGGLDEASHKAMQECGCVYLAQVGGCAALYSTMVKEIIDVIWTGRMPESIYIFRVEEYGPLIVGMDTYGNNIYSEVERNAAERQKDIYERLGLPDH